MRQAVASGLLGAILRWRAAGPRPKPRLDAEVKEDRDDSQDKPEAKHAGDRKVFHAQSSRCDRARHRREW